MPRTQRGLDRLWCTIVDLFIKFGDELVSCVTGFNHTTPEGSHQELSLARGRFVVRLRTTVSSKILK